MWEVVRRDKKDIIANKDMRKMLTLAAESLNIIIITTTDLLLRIGEKGKR